MTVEVWIESIVPVAESAEFLGKVAGAKPRASDRAVEGAEKRPQSARSEAEGCGGTFLS